MRRATQPNTYTIHLNECWSLEDLYAFPRAYEQVYFAIYSLHPDHDEFDEERISTTYSAFPWQGGYSAVNFYDRLKYVVRKRDRPQIKSIQYASPGWIELALLVSVALNVEKIVKAVCGSIKECNSTYSEIMKGLQQRKLLRIKTEQEIIKLRKADAAYVIDSSRKLQKMLAINELGKIDDLSGHPYRSLKILLSLYRRVRLLSEYQLQGKADFNNSRFPSPEPTPLAKSPSRRRTVLKS